METLTFITPTGDRPLAFSLCQRWVRKQTRQPDQWIIIDDGKTPIGSHSFGKGIIYVRRTPESGDPKHTLIPNLKIALQLIGGDKILFIEDDEYYAPKYAETMAARLDDHEIVGIGHSKYYHLSTGGNFIIGNTGHACLAHTAFRKSFLPEFKDLLNTSKDFLDLKLWRIISRNGRGSIFFDDEKSMYVGMKGLPGRLGIGGGHDPDSWRYKGSFPDLSLKILRQWIPDKTDYNIYKELIKGMEIFRDVYKGQTMWIIGKGPSLRHLAKKDIGPGPVMTINQAIIKIEEIDLPNPIFSMQKDGGERKRHKYPARCVHSPDCGDVCGYMVRPKRGATLLVHSHESLFCFPDYSPRHIFDWSKLGLSGNEFSLVLAIKIGILMGCERFNFISCDSHSGCLDEYVPNIGIVRTNPKYKEHAQRVKPYLKGFDYKWITPKEA